MPMRFPYLKAARVKLQERRNACLKSKYDSAGTYIGHFLEFIRTNPIVAPVAAELSIIAKEKFSVAEQLVDSRGRNLCIPSDRTDSAAYFLRVLEVQGEPGKELPNFTHIFGKGSNRYQDMYDDFYEQVLIPLCSYIDEKIDDGDLLLYMLSRYQRECTWFEAKPLLEKASTADSKELEETLDRHLRGWLFREGVDYPFSTPHSPSGRADVVVWHGEEPLAIEVKVFDGESRDLSHVSQGLWQAHRYAQDYGKPFGYLVVFNTSPHLLQFEDNNATSGPPCITVGGTNVFAIVVNVMRDRPTASKERPLETKLVKAPVASPSDVS